MEKIYFMLVAVDCCHDGDEWCGYYTDVEKLKEDYVKAKAALTRENGYTKSFDVEIYAFEPNALALPGDIDASVYERIDIDALFITASS